MNDDSNHERQQQPRATTITTSDDNNHERQQQCQQSYAISETIHDISKQCAMSAIMSDASNNKRYHIVFSFSITEHHDIHLANCLIMPAIMRDGSNYTR